MASFTKLLIHCVFCTYDREPSLWMPGREDLCRYILALGSIQGYRVLAVDGAIDHLHLLLWIRPSIAVCQAVQLIKQTTSRWLGQTNRLPKFKGWQAGYSAFTVSPSSESSVRAYIHGQQTHHLQMGYLEEYWQLMCRWFSKPRIGMSGPPSPPPRSVARREGQILSSFMNKRGGLDNCRAWPGAFGT